MLKKSGGVPLSEKLADNQGSVNNVISENNENNVISNENEVAKEEEKLKLTNDDNSKENSKENSEKLELNSDVEKKSVKAENEEIEYKNYETEIKYDSNMAYGDFRVDQEGVLGQYKDGKELVKPIKKIITVGTNKDLVKKIKYNEKYSIEDPGTFNYTEHALRNIKSTNKGLQRTIYNLREHNLPNYGTDKYNESKIWDIWVNIEDGADISKDLEDLYKIGINDNSLSYLQNTWQYDHVNIKGYSELKNNYDHESSIHEYINLWLMNKKGLLNRDSDGVYVLNDSNKFVNDFISDYKNNDRHEYYGYLKFNVNNNYKVPFVANNSYGLYGTDYSIVYLTRELFDKIYTEVVKELRHFNENNTTTKIDSIWVNSIFVEEPASLKFDYLADDSFVKDNREFEITTRDLNNFYSDLIPDIDYATDLPEVYFPKKLNPDKVYSMQIDVEGYSSAYQKDLDPLIKKYGVGDIYGGNPHYESLFYYNIKNIPYFGDEALKFKERKLIKGDGKKNVVLPLFGDKEGFINYWTNYLAQIEADPKATSEDIEEIKFYIDKAQNAKDSIEFGENLNIANLLDSAIANKQYLNFLNNDSWGDKISNYAIGNVDTKTEEKDFKVIKKDDPTLEEGKTKVVKKGVKGKKVTKITYKVDRTSGQLTDPVSEIVEDVKPIDEVILVGTKKVIPAKPIEDIAKTTKTTKETIKAKVEYEADETLEFEKQQEVKKAVDGEKEITTVSQSGKKDVVTEKVIKDKVDGVTKVGNKKVEVETKDGVTTTTTTIYEVEKETGKLVNPKVTTHKSTKAGIIEDIATTTKTTKEVIKAKVEYEADETLEFEKQQEVKKAVDGEKEITTVSQSGKKDVVTEKVIKDKVDGVTKVGNKKVEVETKDGVTTTTTTIYEVEKETGKLVNPKVTTHKTTKAGIIEDIAKKVIPATKIEDIAKKTIPATKIEDIAKKTIPATKIEDIAKKIIPATKIEDIAKKTIPATKIEDIAKKTIPATKIEDIAKKTIPATKIEDIAKKTIPATKIEDIAKKSNKDSEKETVHEPKRTSHLPKAGTSSEILTLAIGALAMVEGINLSKKRRR